MSSSSDFEQLEEWLQEAVPTMEPPISVTPISLGRSNLTFEVADAQGTRLVLRRPPHGQLQSTAHDMEREFTVLAALRDTAIPVPKVVRYCADAEVIGAPFFLMEFAGGTTIADPASAAALSERARHRLGLASADALASLHREDVIALGLEQLLRPGSYVERQLRRWLRQIEKYPSVTSELVWRVHDLLRDHEPTAQRQSLIHGDFKLQNLRASEDGEIAAVLDWELTSVGDPLADLGWLIASWATPGDGGRWIIAPPSVVGGFPTRKELAERYAVASGLDVGELDYYVALAYWRWSCINEGILDRFTKGQMGGKTIDLEAVRIQIGWQLDAAYALLTRGASYGDPIAAPEGAPVEEHA